MEKELTPTCRTCRLFDKKGFCIVTLYTGIVVVQVVDGGTLLKESKHLEFTNLY